jgi:hypothetical protein
VKPTIVVPSGAQGMHLALTPTHIYWSGASAIMRQAKTGGAPEKVVDIGSGGGPAPFIDQGRLYWSFAPNVYGMALDGDAPQAPLVTEAMNPMAWVVAGGRVWFANNAHLGGKTSDDLDLMSAPAGEPGPARVDARGMETTGPVAADPTGVYWYADTRVVNRDGGALIQKYTLSTAQITSFATVSGVEFLRTDGAHVVWTDSSSAAGTVVWSNTTDGTHPVALGRAPLVRQLATDGSSAYWAASLFGDENSAIVVTPLEGGSARTIACGVSSVYAIAVDETDVYFSTWLADSFIGRFPKSPQ